jgi:hypothetical protein
MASKETCPERNKNSTKYMGCRDTAGKGKGKVVSTMS